LTPDHLHLLRNVKMNEYNYYMDEWIWNLGMMIREIFWIAIWYNWYYWIIINDWFFDKHKKGKSIVNDQFNLTTNKSVGYQIGLLIIDWWNKIEHFCFWLIFSTEQRFRLGAMVVDQCPLVAIFEMLLVLKKAFSWIRYFYKMYR